MTKKNEMTLVKQARSLFHGTVNLIVALSNIRENFSMINVSNYMTQKNAWFLKSFK